jgi:hypothetical protein
VVRNNNNLRRITADQEQSIATLFTLSLKEDWVPVVTDPNIQKRKKSERRIGELWRAKEYGYASFIPRRP